MTGSKREVAGKEESKHQRKRLEQRHVLCLHVPDQLFTLVIDCKGRVNNCSGRNSKRETYRRVR